MQRKSPPGMCQHHQRCGPCCNWCLDKDNSDWCVLCNRRCCATCKLRQVDAADLNPHGIIADRMWVVCVRHKSETEDLSNECVIAKGGGNETEDAHGIEEKVSAKQSSIPPPEKPKSNRIKCYGKRRRKSDRKNSNNSCAGGSSGSESEDSEMKDARGVDC